VGSSFICEISLQIFKNKSECVERGAQKKMTSPPRILPQNPGHGLVGGDVGSTTTAQCAFSGDYLYTAATEYLFHDAYMDACARRQPLEGLLWWHNQLAYWGTLIIALQLLGLLVYLSKYPIAVLVWLWRLATRPSIYPVKLKKRLA
jgi:hypothetical protein